MDQTTLRRLESPVPVLTACERPSSTDHPVWDGIQRTAIALAEDARLSGGDAMLEVQTTAGPALVRIGTHRLRAAGQALVVIWVAPPAEVLPPARDLRRAFGLTPREAEVAHLLAQGHSGKGIARRLGVKTCTARRHTEKVLMKLGIHSRGDVRAVLLGLRQGARPNHTRAITPARPVARAARLNPAPDGGSPGRWLGRPAAART